MTTDKVRTAVVLVMSAREGAASDLAGCAAAAAEILPVATVILEVDPGTPMAAPELAPLVARIQALGIATLIAADAALARVVKADGVHLPASKTIAADYSEARETLGGRFIVGIDAGRTRHDAMTAGEDGADYIGFGIPAHVEDRATARGRRFELISWWSEIFEPPCIAFDVEAPQDAQALAEAGADFVAVRLPVDASPAGVAQILSPYAAALRLAEPAT